MSHLREVLLASRVWGPGPQLHTQSAEGSIQHMGTPLPPHPRLLPLLTPSPFSSCQHLARGCPPEASRAVARLLHGQLQGTLSPDSDGGVCIKHTYLQLKKYKQTHTVYTVLLNFIYNTLYIYKLGHGHHCILIYANLPAETGNCAVFCYPIIYLTRQPPPRAMTANLPFLPL